MKLSKTLSRVDLFENAVFPSSRGRVKSELFETADVTASIYKPSQHAFGSLGITRGHSVYLFSDFEYHDVFVWMRIFSKTLLMWTRIFYTQINKDTFSKYPNACGWGLNLRTWTRISLVQLKEKPVKSTYLSFQ